MNRRDLLATGTAAMLGSGFVAPVLAATPYDPWKDLLNLLPKKSTLSAAREARGTSEVDFEVQKIEDAKSEKINFDFYAIDIQTLPSGVSGAQLFQTVRKSLNDYFDQQYSEFKDYSSQDGKDWRAQAAAPLGAIMQFDIPVGPLEEQAAVVVSKSTATSWVFTPVTIGLAAPGEHPVAGNREFALIGGDGLAARIYTRAADRALARGLTDADENTVYEGADKLWTSFQQKVVEYVNNQGGQASVGRRRVEQPKWSDVVASGAFDRS